MGRGRPCRSRDLWRVGEDCSEGGMRTHPPCSRDWGGRGGPGSFPSRGPGPRPPGSGAGSTQPPRPGPAVAARGSGRQRRGEGRSGERRPRDRLRPPRHPAGSGTAAGRYPASSGLRRLRHRDGSGTSGLLRTRAARDLRCPWEAPVPGRLRCPVAAPHPGGSGGPGAGQRRWRQQPQPGKRAGAAGPGLSSPPSGTPRPRPHRGQRGIPEGFAWGVNPRGARGVQATLLPGGGRIRDLQRTKDRRGGGGGMEKYRREGRVVRLQTGLGATVHRARVGGCQSTLPTAPHRAGGLLGAGGSAGNRGCSHPDGWG